MGGYRVQGRGAGKTAGCRERLEDAAAVEHAGTSALTMESAHKILTIMEVSDLLGVHPFTTHKLVKAGRIPSFRVGNDWRFRKNEIERWVAEKSMDNLR
jgi:excisionase family DNA binding protein